jgi:lysine-N-methylase
MLGPGELEKLKALDWETDPAGAPAVPDLVDVAPGVEIRSEAGGGRRLSLAKRDDGACVYLGAENQCRIHERFGEGAKPLMCRLFPFGFLPVGDRVAVDVSFSCRAVSEERGLPLGERVPEWNRLLVEPTTVLSRFPFSRKYDVSGELLWEIEHHLLEILSDESLALAERVHALVEFSRLATTSDPATDAARKLRQVMTSGVAKLVRTRPPGPDSRRMDKTGRAVFFHLLFLTLNPTPSRLFLLTGKQRAREARLRVQMAEAYRNPEARPWLDNRELPITFRSLAGTGTDYLVGEAGRGLVVRYLESKILGQRFLFEGDDPLPFVEAVPRLALTVPILTWAAKALAAERGSERVQEPDVRRALRLVDRSLGAIRLSLLPPKQRKAWSFVLFETDLPLASTYEMLDL